MSYFYQLLEKPQWECWKNSIIEWRLI